MSMREITQADEGAPASVGNMLPEPELVAAAQTEVNSLASRQHSTGRRPARSSASVRQDSAPTD